MKAVAADVSLRDGPGKLQVYYATWCDCEAEARQNPSLEKETHSILDVLSTWPAQHCSCACTMASWDIGVCRHTARLALVDHLHWCSCWHSSRSLLYRGYCTDEEKEEAETIEGVRSITLPQFNELVKWGILMG